MAPLPELADGTVSWLNVNGVHDPQLLNHVGAHFSLHSLALEDIASTYQRPKVDVYDEQLVITLRMLQQTTDQVIGSEQVTLALGRGYLVSFQERTGDVFGPVRERLRRGAGRLRGVGSDYLCYALLDIVVDYYFVVLERVSGRLEALEDDVLDGITDHLLARLRNERSSLIMIRRAVWPLREVVSTLMRDDTDLIAPETRLFIRDLYDHVVQVIDIVESLRDLGAAINDLYMAAVSNRMNEVMKVLTIVGTIFIPLTFVAGIYGMNFSVMPELSWSYGYPVALAAMGLIGASLALFFRRKGWL